MNLLCLSTPVLFILISVVDGGYSPSPSGGYGYPAVKKYPYLPAPPGETPPCAKNGATYCAKIDTYPTEVISYLLYKWGRTYQQFIKSESDRDFILLSKTYGPIPAPYDSYKLPPQPQDQGQGGYSTVPPSSYLPTKEHGNSTLNKGKEYVASYYRHPQQENNRYQREHQQGHNFHQNDQGGYGYSFNIPPTGQRSPNGHNGGHNQVHQGSTNHNHLMAAAMPPILHSIWWNHNNNGQPIFPHMGQYNQQSWEQRWRRRAKRQAGPEGSLCPTVSNYISPQAAMNNEGNWMYVVNMDQSQYTQFVKSETCARGDGSECNGLCSVPPGFNAACRQKYVQKRLVALDGSGGSLRGDVFWFPHCCSCEVN